MFINQICTLKTKQKRLFQLVFMTAYLDPCFWCKTLKNKLEAQNTSAEKLHCKTRFVQLVLLLKTYRWLLLDTVQEGLRFNCLSYLILYIPNNIQILVMKSTCGIQSSSLESDITFESTKFKKCS